MPDEKDYANQAGTAVRERSFMEGGIDATMTVADRLEALPNRIRHILERLEGPRIEKEDQNRDEDKAESVSHFDRWTRATSRAHRSIDRIVVLITHLESLI